MESITHHYFILLAVATVTFDQPCAQTASDDNDDLDSVFLLLHICTIPVGGGGGGEVTQHVYGKYKPSRRRMHTQTYAQTYS